MIEHEEDEMSFDRLVADIDEKWRLIERNITDTRQLISATGYLFDQNRVLFHALDRMLSERLDLVEAKELAILNETPKSIMVF